MKGRLPALAFVTVLMALVGTVPPVVAASLEDGVKAYDRGDYAEAIRDWQPLADQGNRNAMFNLGQIYRMGKGVPKNLDLAEHYYLEAAKLGHSAAQGNLGTLYYFGKAGGKPRLDLALTWWKIAAHNGDPRSQYMLGVLYFNGRQVKRDVAEAYGWMTLAAASGLAEAEEAQKKMLAFMTPDEIATGRRLAKTLTKGPAPAMPGGGRATATAAEPPVAADRVPGDNSNQSQRAPDVGPKADQKAGEASAPPAPNASSSSKSAGSPAAGQAPDETAPQPPMPASSPLAAGRYHVQLGSYRSESEAKQQWSHIQSTYHDLLPDDGPVFEKADLGPEKGIYYRLQVGAFASSKEAGALCKSLKTKGQTCLVVKSQRQ